MKKIKCSIVGLGRIGSFLEDDSLREKPASHAGAIKANPHCVILSGCDIDKERCERFQKRWECKNVFTDFHKMLEFEKPDILNIATPPETHKDIILEAARAEIPVVICEKPLTESIKEAKQIIDFISPLNTILMVNHERRYSKDYINLKKIIQENIYGDLFTINCRLYMGRGAKVKEMLWEDGTHLIDIIRFLTNKEISFVNAKGNVSQPGGECVFILKAGEIFVLVDAACNREYLAFELDVSFFRGFVKIGNGIYEEYESCKSPFYEKARSLIKKRKKLFPITNYFAGMLEDAVNLFFNHGKPKTPVSSGMDGFKAVVTIENLISQAEKINQ